MVTKKPNGTPQELKRLEDKLIDRNPTDPHVARLNQKWLSGQSHDDLIDIILELKTMLPNGTKHLDSEIAANPISALAPASRPNLEVKKFLRLPTVSARKRDYLGDTLWRLIFTSLNSKYKPLALEIYGDVFIGRSAQGINPDLDLTDYDQRYQSVSRQHALLRPTKANLFLIDLGSTNGTFCNGRPLSTGATQKLNDRDTIAFGTVRFSVMFVN